MMHFFLLLLLLFYTCWNLIWEFRAFRLTHICKNPVVITSLSVQFLQFLFSYLFVLSESTGGGWVPLTESWFLPGFLPLSLREFFLATVATLSMVFTHKRLGPIYLCKAALCQKNCICCKKLYINKLELNWISNQHQMWFGTD